MGIGSFGLVYIALHQPSGRYDHLLLKTIFIQIYSYVAIKEMFKARLEKSKQMSHVISEKHLLSTLHHPFILKYYVALNEEKKIFIVTETLLGGELFQRIVNPAGVPTPLSMESSRFYAGCVIYWVDRGASTGIT